MPLKKTKNRPELACFDVLKLLSPEEFVSGEVIARNLGCSRATVNNALHDAQAAGVVVHAVPGRGYRLARPLNWFDVPGLQRVLQARGMHLQYFQSLPSTNSYVLRQAQSGEGLHKSVVLAEQQTEGRGRRGRTWLAEPGAGLTFSLLWCSSRPAVELSGLSLAVGVMLVQGLRRLGLAQVAVKWPNDIVLGGAKLAGVLIELAGDMLGPSAAVIGVGLNVRGGEALTREVGQAVTDLAAHLGEVDRNQVLLTVLAALDEGLAQFERAGFAAFHADWEACHAFHGEQVTVLTALGERITGQSVGVDAHGALLLATASGVQRFHSGEVSLRGGEA